jgi:hypothetical protein
MRHITIVALVIQVLSSALALRASSDSRPSGLEAKIAGLWKEARHTTRYSLDHKLYIDPTPGRAPRGEWSIAGPNLTETYDDGRIVRYTIKSVNHDTLILVDIHGSEYVLKRCRAR